jgi:hypothetical protein
MTQTGGLVILYAWLIFGGLLAVLAYLLLRHEQDPLQDLKRPSQDDQDDQDEVNSLPAPTASFSPGSSRASRPAPTRVA